MDRLAKGLAGLRLTHTHNIAGTGCSGREKMCFITHGAGRLGSSTIDAEIIRHGSVLTQKTSQFLVAVSQLSRPSRVGIRVVAGRNLRANVIIAFRP
jgi:hypothetical protein